MLSKRRLAALLALCLLAAQLMPARAQQPQQPPQSPAETPAKTPGADEEIVRVSAELVQTGVSVFDRKGQFVGGLRAEDFELRVDDTPQPITFFDRVTEGRARASAPKTAAKGAGAPSPIALTPRGRTVLFFVDDLHLASDSVVRARTALRKYIDQQMGPDDQAAVTSASGELGFLQQLTDNKGVLRAAVARLKFHTPLATDAERPQMSVYQALAVESGDEETTGHFVALLLADALAGMRRSNAEVARTAAEQLVHNRARRILRQSSFAAKATLTGLESLVRSAAALPGRKLAVFVSDGFFLDPNDTVIAERLRRLTDAGARAGVVVYTMQASGLTTTFPDAASDAMMDGSGGTGSAALGEDTARQTPLVTLAADTGGRALLNANDLAGSLTRALDEASEYYLLAWRPDAGLLRARNFHRLEVRVKGRPELSVRVHRGFFNDDTAAAARRESAAAAPPDPTQLPWQELAAALRAPAVHGTLPTHLAVTWLDAPGKPHALSLFVQATLPPGQAAAPIDVAGAVYNDEGKLVGSFLQHLDASDAATTATPTTNGTKATNATPTDAAAGSAVAASAHNAARNVTYYTPLNVKPGLYQVRVAARDGASGATGRAVAWIEVPDLTSGRLALSSLLLGERAGDAASAGVSADGALPKAQLKVDARFDRRARLRLLTYIYNATRRAGTPPQLDVQLELWRDNRLLVAAPLRRAETAGVPDLARIPFAEELTLSVLPAGRYLLRVTVFDRAANASATQQTRFEID